MDIIELYLRNNNTSQAAIVYADMLANHDETENSEVDAYTELYNFKLGLIANNMSINSLDSPAKQSLETIANTYNKTFAGQRARNALCFFYNNCLPQNFVITRANNKHAKSNGKISVASNNIEVYPNPAKNYVVFKYNGGSGSTITLHISDTYGKQIFSKEIEENKKQYVWDTRNISNGSYIYTISIASGEKYMGKVTVAK